MASWHTDTARDPIKEKRRNREKLLWSLTPFCYNVPVVPIGLIQPEDSQLGKCEAHKAQPPRAECGREPQRVVWDEAKTKFSTISNIKVHK